MTQHFDKDGKPITFERWAELFSDERYKRVAYTELTEDTYVSTVWLGYDKSARLQARPRIFETQVKQGRTLPLTRKCRTERAALRGHDETIVLMAHQLSLQKLRN